MPLTRIKGKPTGIKEITLETKDMIAMGFEAAADSDLPKGLSSKELLVLMDLNQWQELVQSIMSTGDSLNNANDIIIEGEVKNIKLPDDNPKGVSTIVCSKTEYYKEEKREKVEKEKPQREDEKHIEQEPKSKSKPKSNSRSVKQKNKDIAELHKKYNGVCQGCGQRCDKKVVTIKKKKGERVIACPDCSKKQKRPNFRANNNLVKWYSQTSNIDEEKARKELESFPTNYALVAFGSVTRVYWSWEKDGKIETLFVNHTGDIFNLRYEDGTQFLTHLDKPKFKRKNQGEFFIRGDAYQIVKTEEIPVEKIEVPERFLNSSPRREKIDEKINYYKQHKKFDRDVVVIKKGDKAKLADGYIRYVVIKELNLNKAKVVYVEKANS
ncbi:hypothetical protein O0Q50_20935 [Priestia aryabhattai]|uniref:Uncharacterized protein n=1 Tax=Priestia aryabhattai TaxID=412384 RepID=A0AAX6NDS1_PRIAR|nr:hypothetical protein [Priestia aryabhattai]MDU9693644.1 hypothetical protein [Priestia aryabhattai]